MSHEKKTLKELFPDLAAQWHPTKNGDLTPDTVAVSCRKQVWWYLPYDDPVTGKHFDFEWESSVENRVFKKSGCPYLSNKAVWPGFNDLATRHPKLAAEWHPTKNGGLTPAQVVPGCRDKVWWYLPYDDPVTGKHFDFEWESSVVCRVSQKAGCPYLSNAAAWPGFNDLATQYPELAAEWHPTKNGGLTPAQAVPGSTAKVWWYLPYDDPVMGKHFDFEWEASVERRVSRKSGCPYLSNKAVWPGFNDLATRHPKLAAEWHPTKNGGLTPAQVVPGRNAKVWWYHPYDDPVTGKHFDFEWEASVLSRVAKKSGCPYLSNAAVWPGFNDLATRHPELAAEWHPTKNGGLTPAQVVPGCRDKVWWYLPYDDPVTGKHFDFEWESSIAIRVSRKVGCPYLSNKAVWPGFNDLATRHPELAAEWHPTKNGGLTPAQVVPGCRDKVWWYLPYDDPVTGKHFDFEWESSVVCRVSRKAGCPYLSNKAVWPGFNDLATRHPKLAAEWHPTKNGGLTPAQVVPGCRDKVWWYLPYDDPVTGKHFDFEWDASVAGRVYKKAGCPYLSNAAAWPGFNDLATQYPELAAEWHPTKNGGLTPAQVVPGCRDKVWWYLPYDDPVTGKHFDFEWEASVVHRVSRKSGCPYLSNKAAWPGFNDLATRHPKLAAEWHPTKNGGLTPAQVVPGRNAKVWWYLPYDDPVTGKHFDFEWEASVMNRVSKKSGCPYLSNAAVWPGFNDLATHYPELAAEWHPTKNGGLTPDQVTLGGTAKVWWYLPYDDPVTGKHFDFEWESSIAIRVSRKVGCPYLSNKAVWPGFNDLATHYPELAAEWHPTKNNGTTPDKVLAGGMQWGWWIMPYDDKETGKHFVFEWHAKVSDRIKNPDCPFIKNKRVWTGYNDLQTCFPEIADEWHPDRNRTTPDKVMKNAHKKAWWKCKHGHEWYTHIYLRTRDGSRCPKCHKMRKRYGNWTIEPEGMSEEGV